MTLDEIVSQDEKPPGLSLVIDEEEENDGDMIFNSKDIIGVSSPN
jgi:hypothetical protein